MLNILLHNTITTEISSTIVLLDEHIQASLTSKDIYFET